MLKKSAAIRKLENRQKIQFLTFRRKSITLQLFDFSNISATRLFFGERDLQAIFVVLGNR